MTKHPKKENTEMDTALTDEVVQIWSLVDVGVELLMDDWWSQGTLPDISHKKTKREKTSGKNIDDIWSSSSFLVEINGKKETKSRSKKVKKSNQRIMVSKS